MNPFDVWDKSCELCGKGTAIFTIDKQLHGEYRRLHVCQKCKDKHERDLELCRSNFQTQFGEPEPKKNTYNWIKVEDALPETSDSVLVYTDRGHKYIGYYVNEYWCCDSQVSAFAYRMTDKWSGEVTHWMPLPDDPV